MENHEPPLPLSFKIFQRFHCFYYSRHNDEIFFLLRKKKNNLYSHFRGKLNDLDPAIFFSVGRKLVKLSCGLLLKQNLNFFAEHYPQTENLRDMVQLCKPNLQTPQLSQSKLYQKFIEDTFEEMKHYQDETDAAYFFIEIPYVDLERLHTFCKDLPLSLELKYATRQELISNEFGLFSDALTGLFNKRFSDFVEKYIELNETPALVGRYAVLSIVTTPTNYRTLGLLSSYFKKHGEQWRCYRYPVEEPTEQELLTFDGIFIPGASVCAADKTLPWREKLLELIRSVYEQGSKCKILGTCFGLQIIAEAFQGKCEKMKEFVKGSSNLDICPSFWDLPYIRELNLEPRTPLLIPKSHFDAVTEAPAIATVYASSDCCPVEIMAIGDRCLAFQGHPEMNEAWTACLLYQATKEKLNFKLYYEEMKKKYFQGKLEYEMWLRIMNNFFKRKQTCK